MISHTITEKVKKFNAAYKLGDTVFVKHADGSVSNETLRWHEAEITEAGYIVWLAGHYDAVPFESIVEPDYK